MAWTTKTWAALALAVAGCSTNGGEMAQGPAGNDAPGSEAPSSSTRAGGQSGTEGHAACFCRLGEPIGEIALDSEPSQEYPWPYSPSELLDMVVGQHTFYCKEIAATVVVDVERGASAWLLRGALPSDTNDGRPDRECRGIELDAKVRISASNGLEASATRLQVGAQCGIGPRSVVVSDVTNIDQATLEGQPVDAAFSLWATQNLLLSYTGQTTVHCAPTSVPDAGLGGDAQAADAMR
jgi:hypothetical protein